MKHLFYLIVTGLLSFVHTTAQKKMNAATYDRFLKEYKTTNESDKAIRQIPKDTSVHPFAIASRQLTQKNVFINEDIVSILQELNPKVDMSDKANPVSGETALIYPNFPTPSQDALQRFNMHYRQDALPDATATNLFAFESERYKKLFAGINRENKNFSIEFYDSLKYMNDKILPYLDKFGSSISKQQMEYFVKELKQLNYYLTPKKTTTAAVYMRPGTAATNSHPIPSYIVEDFYEIVKPFFVKKINTVRGGVQVAKPASNQEWIFFDQDSWAPFVCNLFIFAKDSVGNRKKDPEVSSFTVWIGDKMSYTTRNNATDPASYGFLKMPDKASTLPFNVGYGKWIVIMKLNEGSKELTTEVIIRSNIPVSAEPIKVCYELN